MSLRARLLLGAAMIAVVLTVTAVGIARTTRSHLVDQVDAQLRSAGPQLGDRPRGPGTPVGGEADGGPRLSSFYIGLISASGVLTTISSPDLAGDVPPSPVVDSAAVAALRDGRSITVPSSDPRIDYRIAARDELRAGAVTVLALPLDGVDTAVRRLVAVEAVATAGVLATVGLVMWWVIRLGVRPVRRMTETAGAIAAGDLSQRVPEGAPGTEAGQLGVALNGMLGRIEEAFDQRAETEARLRQFVADASHELRTPLATIRGYAELYRSGALDQPAGLDDAMRRTEQESIRMGTLVDDLLQLARLDQGRPLHRAPVDLVRLAEDAVRDALVVNAGRALTVAAPEPVTVLADEGRLHQVLANLVANALVHAPEAAIEVRVYAEGATAVIEVADDGPGMSDDDAARAFERFHRADASRSRHHGGSGLGLAIVDATVRAHGGTASITTSLGHGTTVRVELP